MSRKKELCCSIHLASIPLNTGSKEEMERTYYDMLHKLVETKMQAEAETKGAVDSRKKQ